jgi:carbohydrate kinase (thermoresistant glucokinase family)
MPRVIGLRSPHARVGRIVYFGRMLDKIRLRARGSLPGPYVANLGDGRPELLDGQCCRFLGLAYPVLRSRVLEGGCDEELLQWAHRSGSARSDEDCLIWNRFLSKRGWRDDRSDALARSAAAYGLSAQKPETVFELLDLDEERPAGATRSWEAPPLSVLVVMGVSGSGKSTVGAGLAAELGWAFIDSDALHPPANIAKMSAGIPLGDSDRAPWIAIIRAEVASRRARGERCVVAFSALKAAYRDALAPDPADRRFVHLRGGEPLIRERLNSRSGHFMKSGLLDSQYEALEEPLDALTLDVNESPGALIARIRKVFGL